MFNDDKEQREAVALPDPVARWKADSDARAAARAAAKAEIAAASRPTVDWDAIDQRIQQALTAECRSMVEALATELGKWLEEDKDTMKAMREELRELKIECAKLGSQAAELRAQMTIDRSQIIDLPSSPLARRGVN